MFQSARDLVVCLGRSVPLPCDLTCAAFGSKKKDSKDMERQKEQLESKVEPLKCRDMIRKGRRQMRMHGDDYAVTQR